MTKHFDAYADIPWDDPDYAVDVEDPRFVLPASNTLSQTQWYQSQSPAIQAKIGCHITAFFMKRGAVFENVLKRGMLEFTTTLDDGAPEYRYAYHEVIEEAQHGLMFQEFANRTGLPLNVMPKAGWRMARGITKLGVSFPELFFFHVIGGEDPIDYSQRLSLRNKEYKHPLVKRISQIHVTEEARHLSFARNYLLRHVPLLSKRKKHKLRYMVPLSLGRSKLYLPDDIIKMYDIPKEVVKEAFHNSEQFHRDSAEALRKVRDLCIELDLVRPWTEKIWRRGRIWAED